MLRTTRRVITVIALGIVSAAGVASAAPPWTVPTPMAIPVVGIAATNTGYVQATATGRVFTFHTRFYGSPYASRVTLSAPVAGIAVDPRTEGYWVATVKGQVYSFHAPSYGSLARKRLPAPVVGIAATGTGYLLVTAKGNVYSFHTRFYGSPPASRIALRAPVEGIAADPHTNGYWLTTTRGDIYSFGAPFYGSLARKRLRTPVSAIAATPTGYLLVTARGSVYAFHTSFYGSVAAKVLRRPISGIAVEPNTKGRYWLTATNRAVYGFKPRAPLLSSYTLRSSTYSVPIQPWKYPTVHALCGAGSHVAGHWAASAGFPSSSRPSTCMATTTTSMRSPWKLATRPGRTTTTASRTTGGSLLPLVITAS
jgi:hypothetical protein